MFYGTEQAMKFENALNKKQQAWITNATPNAKASALVENEAKKAPTTLTKPNPLNTQSTPKPTTPQKITKEELKEYINSNPFFRH
ncbi:hypothetical protein [Helicobacter pylori]|uniref:hypothetical protein n=1 Tax=Helicobacter pylori TaxID=210 RepID=UPI000EB1C120|nr:hypothetical protein [Helicobacter pylori]